MRGRWVATGAGVLVIGLIVVGGCGPDVKTLPTPTVELPAGLADNAVVIRVHGPIERRHPPAQWIVDRVGEILPGSRSATVWFAGLADGSIVEADCLAEKSGDLSADDCGEVGLASGDVLELLGLQDVDRTISSERAGVAFDPDAFWAGRIQIRTGESTIDLAGVHGLSSSRWPGLPTVWIPNLQPSNGLVAQPFAVVVAATAPLTEPQHEALQALDADVTRLEEEAAVVASAADGGLSPDCVQARDKCGGGRVLRAIYGFTEIYTARSDPSSTHG